MKLFDMLGRLRGPIPLVCAFMLVPIVGFIDYWTGYDVSLSLFYLIPIGLATWTGALAAGIPAATLGTAVRVVADLESGHVYASQVAIYWNSAVRLGFYLVVVLLIAGLKRALEHERELSGTDYLTGAINSRSFKTALDAEIERSTRYRHPFSLAYVDIDNFKALNDKLGHSGGDEVLRAIVAGVKRALRKTDTVARLGGDEFVVLLPESGEIEAKTAVAKIREGLRSEMESRNLHVTISVGCLTVAGADMTHDAIIKEADSLMYRVKHEGKDAVIFATER